MFRQRLLEPPLVVPELMPVDNEPQMPQDLHTSDGS